MDPQTIFLPARRRIGRKRKGAAATTPAMLNLIAATFEEEPPAVVLAFDRAIDIAAFDGSQLIVDEGLYVGLVYEGTGPTTLPSPTSVRVELVSVGEDFTPGLTLTASGDTGIVAVDDGGTWGGVTNLELPFG